MIPKHDKDGNPLVWNGTEWVQTKESLKAVVARMVSPKSAVAQVEAEKEARSAIRKSKRKQGKRR